MMGWYEGGWSYGWVAVMMVVWLLLLGVAVWAVVALTRGGGGDRSQVPPPPPTPREILDGRFAAGEISQQEYVGARGLLEGHDRSPAA